MVPQGEEVGEGATTWAPIPPINGGNPEAQQTVRSVLRAYPGHLHARTIAMGATIRILADGERYRDVSPALRRLGIDVDAWPAPPAGLYVVEERAMIVRSLSLTTLGHEYAHCVDAALGGGTYRSTSDPDIRMAYAQTTGFLTPYAASGLDEYFAESGRAMASGGLNDASCPWPPATAARLRKIDPRMYRIMSEFFDGTRS